MKGVIRPARSVLPDSAQIPDGNLVDPPSAFTHAVTGDQAYYYHSRRSKEAAGTFSAGTRVKLVSTGGSMCRVVDGRGLSVYTACDGLEPLTPARSSSRSKRRAR